MNADVYSIRFLDAYSCSSRFIRTTLDDWISERLNHFVEDACNIMDVDLDAITFLYFRATGKFNKKVP